ncbi:phage tail tape measure protein [Afifella sp. IM 167]|uniref:phage tail tape measure protein n=1 Tax=Afifella sp. IM 167 TaxID=2033586 RepID=UPI001CCE47B6|nr:phage tail tape measure protein [Afifella sp. IM 167]MBZ8133223.1 phage tail tape measure protein [Afifella sp. IM 167]
MNRILEATLRLVGKDAGAGRMLASVGGKMQEMDRRAARFNRSNGALMSGLVGAGRMLTRVLGPAAIGYGLKRSADEAANFESAMTGVQKKAGATAEEMANIRKEVLDLATSGELAVSIEEIAAAFERGAAAGIPLDELRAFAALSAKAADAFDMSAEEVGNAAAGFTVGLGVARDEMEKYFDLINTLADSGIADEKDIISFLDRAGASLKLFGLSKEQSAALGASLLNLKMPAEVAARAMDTLTGKLLNPKGAGPKAWHAFKTVVGDTEKFARLMDEDANAALLTFLENLDRMDKRSRVAALQGLLGQGFDDEVMRLVAGSEEVKRNLAIAADESRWAGSLGRSYAMKLDDYNSQLQVFANRWRELKIAAGTAVLPALTSVVEKAGELMMELSDGTGAAGELVGELKAAGEAFRVSLDWGEIGEAKYAAEEVLRVLQRVAEQDFNVDFDGSAIVRFAEDLAKAINDTAEAIRKLEEWRKRVADPGGTRITEYGEKTINLGMSPKEMEAADARKREMLRSILPNALVPSSPFANPANMPTYRSTSAISPADVVATPLPASVAPETVATRLSRQRAMEDTARRTMFAREVPAALSMPSPGAGEFSVRPVMELDRFEIEARRASDLLEGLKEPISTRADIDASAFQATLARMRSDADETARYVTGRLGSLSAGRGQLASGNRGRTMPHAGTPASGAEGAR